MNKRSILTVIERIDERANLARLMEMFPVVAIVGPRQCGKSTLARTFDAAHFFDLEYSRE